MGTPRAKMLSYMQSLKSQVGYVSLKTKYVEQQARSFPSLPGFDTDISSSMDEVDSEDLVPVNPIEEKDKQIAALEKTVGEMKTKESEIIHLKETVFKSTAELNFVKKEHNTTLQKLSFTQKATEDRLLSNIANPDGFHADPVLIGVYSATLDEAEFDFDDIQSEDQTSETRSRKEKFLKSMEDKVDLNNMQHKERFMEIKNQILEKVKATKVSRLRSTSRTRTASQSSKRGRSSDSQHFNGEKSPVRPRTTGIPKKM